MAKVTVEAAGLQVMARVDTFIASAGVPAVTSETVTIEPGKAHEFEITETVSVMLSEVPA